MKRDEYDKLIYNTARIIWETGVGEVLGYNRDLGAEFDSFNDTDREPYLRQAEAVLGHLLADNSAYIEGLSDLLDGKAVIVPVEPTVEMIASSLESSLKIMTDNQLRELTPQDKEPLPSEVTRASYKAMLEATPYKES